MIADADGAAAPPMPRSAVPAAPSAATAPQDRVPLPQKIGFGLGSFLDMWGHWLYQSLAFHVFNVFLGVAPGLISTALGLKIFVDAVSDALFGWISDNTRTRWGRRRPFILVGGVLAGIGLPLMFAVGRGWSDGEYFAFMLVSTCLYVPVMSCFNMPWNSLGAEMTPDYHERTRVMSVKNAIQKLPELAMFVAAQFTTLAVFNDASGKPDILRGAQVYTAILGGIMVVVSVLIFSLTRERYYEAVVKRSTRRVPFKDTLYRTLKNRPFRQMLGTMLAYNMATAMVGLLGYYATVYYVCGGNVVEATRWNSMMGVAGLVCGLVGISFAGRVARRRGKRNALMTVLSLGILAFVGDWFFYDPVLPALQLLASGGVAFVGAGFWTLYERELPRYAEVTELDTDPKAFCEALKNELLAVSWEVDLAWPQNAHAEIVDGRLSLKKPPRVSAHPDATRLQEELDKRLRPVGIIDVLMAVESWLDLHKMFKPLAGTESRLEDLRVRVIMVLFCYGCNLGPAQLSRSIRSLSAKQLAWINLKYVTEDLLEKVTAKVINKFSEFELPSYWGTGEHASADGTRFNLYERNLLSEYHIRYGAYGGIQYTRVSDRFIALFSHFISCGTYEGLFILDHLNVDESEQTSIRPSKLHGDTHQQSYAAFAMSKLIGVQLMPRIRAIHNLDFFKPTKSAKYENIDSLFKGTIDWELIETHLPMMFKIGVSIKLGRLTPSTILRRLGTHSRKNKLYFAFQELGKVLRTIFLLKYISDVDLRRFINAETNKSEQFNNFLKLSFFGNGGLIAENLRHEQQKVMKFGHLMANILILYNVHDMERVIRELRDEGFPISPDVLGDLNPYRLAHINLLGDYAVDRRRRVADLIVEPILRKKASGGGGTAANGAA